MLGKLWMDSRPSVTQSADGEGSVIVYYCNLSNSPLSEKYLAIFIVDIIGLFGIICVENEKNIVYGIFHIILALLVQVYTQSHMHYNIKCTFCYFHLHIAKNICTFCNFKLAHSNRRII